jgi:hypothetical protein
VKQKKLITLIISSLFVFLFLMSSLTSLTREIKASAPYGTMTMGPDNTLVATQTAYEPNELVTAEFTNPQDLVYDHYEETLIVADTGNARVVILDEEHQIKRVLDEELSSPTGVSFDEIYYYVADKTRRVVNVYEKDTGVLHKQILKPDTPLFGLSSPFTPTKVSVNPKGIYIISDGATKGVIQMNIEGEFMGYVGANRTEKSFASFLQDIFFSKQQKESILKAAPPSPNNLSFNSQGLLYTVTSGDANAPIKKLNTLGNIIMSPSYGVKKIVSISIDESDNIFGVTSDGQIVVYDSFGNLLFLFGDINEYTERFGNLKQPTAISVLPNRKLAILDSETSAIITYQTTDFANLIFRAVDYYVDGLYLEGQALWEEIIQMNEMFILSYKALAAANMKLGNYELALKQYELAEDRNGYSEAFWNIRNIWLQNNLLSLFWVVIGIIMGVLALYIVYRRTKIFDRIALLFRKLNSLKPTKQMTFGLKFQRQPSDAVYLIKYEGGAGVLSASLLYVWFIALQVLNVLITGYLFSSRNIYNTQIFELVFFSVAPLFLWIIANYFVSTVSDGEGKLKHLYIGTIYALTPYLIFALPIFLLSRILTLNEGFIYTLANVLIYGWCVVLLFKNYQEMHDYSFSKTIKNILLTAVCFIFFILAVYMLYMLSKQLFDYIAQVLREVLRNA